MKNIVIFVPTYNEAENIELLIKQINDVLPESKILIVDDNSPDGTSQIVEQLKSKYKNLVLVVRKENRGRGYAGIEGFKKSLELGADIIVEMDGDLSHSPYEIKKLISEIENEDVDIVVGSRYIPGGKDSERNIIRKLVSLFARVYIRIFTGIPLKDITSGFKVYKSKVIKTILPHLKASDPFIVTEVNYLAKINNFKFKEVPIEFHQRQKGVSKLTAVKLIKYLFKVINLVWENFVNEPYTIKFLKFLLLTTVLRIFLIPTFGLTDDEAHYWQYAQYLDYSYYDHPPMVGWIIYLFTKIFGNNLYGVRLPAVLCFSIASLYFYLLIKKLFSSKISFYSSVLLNFIPIFFIGSIITIPDAPLGMFWCMYMYYFYKFVETKNSWILYLCGILLGLTVLSKYNAIFLFISTMIVFLSSKELRRWFLKKEFYAFLTIIFVTSLPVILWNITHNFVSFNYQLHHGMGNKFNFSIITFLQNFGAQGLYLSPIVFLFLWYYIITCWNKEKNLNEKFLLTFSLPGIIGFNLIGFSNQILPHWPTISYLPLVPSIMFYYKKNWQYQVSVISAFLITISVFIITMFGLIKIPKNLENADTPDKLFGWDTAAKEMLNLKLKYQEEWFIITHKHYIAGQIRFSLSQFYPKNVNIPKVYCINDYLDQYDFWNKDLCSLNNKNAIFVTENRFPVEEILSQYPFSKYKLVSKVKYKRNFNWPTRTFLFYYMENFDCKNLPSKFLQLEYNNFLSVPEFFRNYDKDIFLKINKNRFSNNRIYKYIFYGFTSLGNGYFLIPIIIFVLYFIDKKSFVYNTIVFLIIVATGGILIQILKLLFDKPRPLKLFTEFVNIPINVIGEPLKEFGFPSGHTFLAFSCAMYLSERIKKVYFTIAFFTIAILVGVSRICVGAHFVSDVVGGILVGILYTHLCLKIEDELK